MRTIDEVIDELKRTTGVRFGSNKKNDKAVIRLDLMPDVLHYLREYMDSQKRKQDEQTERS